MRRVRVPGGIADVAVLAAGLLMLAPAEAWAYIDPGTGSMAYQVLLAGILAAGVLIRRSWARIKEALKPRREPQAPLDSPRDPR